MPTFDEIKKQIESWLPSNRRLNFDPFTQGVAEQHLKVRQFAEALILESEVGTATGDWLDLAASNYGFYRTSEETDTQFRRRASQRANGLTAENILTCVNELLADEGFGAATLTEWFEGDHFVDINVYADLSYVPMPNGFIVDVPSDVPANTCTAVGAVINDKRAAGVSFAITQDIVFDANPTMDNTVLTMDNAVVTMDAAP